MSEVRFMLQRIVHDNGNYVSGEKADLCLHEINQLQDRLREADVIIKHLASSPHPYTVHEHRDTLEHRFGLQIEVARTYTEKYGEKEEGK